MPRLFSHGSAPSTCRLCSYSLVTKSWWVAPQRSLTTPSGTAA